MKTKNLRFACLLRIAAPVCFALPLLAATTAKAQMYTLTTLATFNGANGSEPYATMTLDSSGNLYGSTEFGGASNSGTIFEIAAGTDTLTTLANFNGANGAYPFATLTPDSSGNFYGTTGEGGTNNYGTFFEIAAGTNTLTTLADFTSRGDPGALTMDSSGDFYGTSSIGGANNDGTVFEIAAGTDTITTVANFNGANGGNPVGALTFDSSGDIYGTAAYYGANNDGTVFEIAAGTDTITTVANFNGTNGRLPVPGLTMDSSGNLFGTTEDGGASDEGTVYEIAAGTDTISTLVNFSGADGAYPFGGLTLDASGNLYGTTENGGTSDAGTVFEIAAGTDTLTTLANFSGSAVDTGPIDDLVLDSSGDLYGTTNQDGPNGDGTVFKLTPSGAASAPEPGALALLAPAIGVLAGAAARRRRG